MNCLRFSGSALAGDVLGRDGRAADDEQVDAGVDDGLRRAAAVRCGDRAPATVTPAVADLARAARRSARAGSARRRSPAAARSRSAASSAGDLGEQRRRVVVAGPQALEVEHAAGRRAGRARSRSPATSTESIGAAMHRDARTGRRRSARRPRPPRGRGCAGSGTIAMSSKRVGARGRACPGRSRSRRHACGGYPVGSGRVPRGQRLE